MTKNGPEIISGIGINREYKDFYVQKNEGKSIPKMVVTLYFLQQTSKILVKAAVFPPYTYRQCAGSIQTG
jgi:hypothetical protein